MTPADGVLAGSFRDPSGFVFVKDGEVFRQVNRAGREHYDALMTSGLYDALVRDRLLVPHSESDLSLARTPDAYKVLRPAVVPFISYPYEWCFSQLKDAALATLTIQKRAFERGLSLRDASAFNIQFVDGRPLLIDTLSFERCREGEPWGAYGQFCRHFLAPLALMAYRDARLGRLLSSHLDGIPLDLASRMLPWRTRLRFSLLIHIHLHARSRRRHARDERLETRGRKVSRLGFQGIVDSLESAVKRLRYRPAGTDWADYYDDTNYTPAALAAKERLVGAFLDRLRPKVVWDLGANTGRFSRLAAARGALTVAADSDVAAVERAYLDVKSRGETRVLPLVIDLASPTPAVGWENAERASFLSRGPADAALALALVHHLAVANNVPLDAVARFFARVARALVVEFVPKSDSQVKRLLATREDIFPDYTREGFERAFAGVFVIEDSAPVPGAERTLYLMRRR
jgi:hypothetical protein